MSTRREFLILTSISAVAAAALGPRLAAAPPASAPTLAAGFAAPAGGVLGDAASVPSPDGTFISRGVRVFFAGARHPRLASALDADFTYFDGAKRRVAPFRVWGRGGNGLSFVMSVEIEQKLSFNVLANGTTLPVTLTLQSGKNSLKLVPGFYVFAPIAPNASAPKWQEYEVREADGRWIVCSRGGAEAAFEYFLLRIDYANTAS